MIPGMTCEVQIRDREVQIRDREVLSKFPRAVRRRVLRALYLPRLQGAYLLASPRIRGKPNFLLTMLDLGTVDMYVPGVAVVEANARVNDFLILLDGEMRVRPHATAAATHLATPSCAACRCWRPHLAATLALSEMICSEILARAIADRQVCRVPPYHRVLPCGCAANCPRRVATR